MPLLEQLDLRLTDMVTVCRDWEMCSQEHGVGIGVDWGSVVERGQEINRSLGTLRILNLVMAFLSL